MTNRQNEGTPSVITERPNIKTEDIQQDRLYSKSEIIILLEDFITAIKGYPEAIHFKEGKITLVTERKSFLDTKYGGGRREEGYMITIAQCEVEFPTEIKQEVHFPFIPQA